MKIETKKIKLSDIKPNPDNPRQITEKQLDKLVKSLQEFPEMRQIREIVVDENMMILGGNMRYRAMEKIGEKTAEVKIVTGLTNEQKREFIIKDNAAFGEWDMDLLSTWDDLPLTDWGVSLPVDWLRDNEDKKESIVPEKDPNILARISFHPGVWLGKREEIIKIFEQMKKTYECDVKVEE